MNRDLNALPAFSNLACRYCGRKYPSVTLDIEGLIHHHGLDPACVDKKDCKKHQKKYEKAQKRDAGK